MNQILYVQDKKKSSIDTKKVLLIFAIGIIIFGLIILTIAIINKPKEKKEKGNNNENTVVTETEPTIEIETVSYNVSIKVTHDKQLSAVIYKWNDDDEVVQEEINDNSYMTTISVPTGKNKLVVKAIDVNGKETTKEEEINGEVEKPIIEVTSMEFNKVKVTITSQVKIVSVYYKWNNEEDQSIPIGENASLIEQEIDVPLGLNTLIITATDEYNIIFDNKNIFYEVYKNYFNIPHNIGYITNGIIYDEYNNITVETKDVKGAKKPEIELTRKGQYVYMVITDEEAVESVQYSINGQTYKLSISIAQEVNHRIKLVEGENKIIVTATNVNKGTTEKRVKTTYTP